MAAANDVLFDATLRHQIKLLRFSKGEAEAVAQLLQASDEQLVAKLMGELTEDARHRLEDLLQSIRAQRSAAIDEAGGRIQRDMSTLAGNEAEWEMSAMEQSSPLKLDLKTVPASTLKALVGKPINGVPLEGWLDSMKAGDISRIEQQIRLAVTQGETLDQIVRRIRGTKANNYEDGVVSITRRNAQAVARTAVNHVSNSARQEVWNANADIISGVRWVATLDGRTSPVCRGRDGLIMPINEGPRPPAHVGCRSTTVPVLHGEAIVGQRPTVTDKRTRSARERDFRAEAREEAGDKWKGMSEKQRQDAVRAKRADWTAKNVGQTPSNQTYDQWMRKQPAAFQDEVMGKAKAQMFRDGMTMDKFVDEKGKAYTIDQLKAETSGDKLNVVQPGVGMKAKALLQQGFSTDDVLKQIQQEYPDASTSAASIASYKSELKKAGALDQLVQAAPAGAVKKAQSVQAVVDHFEANLPEGVKHAVGGQWATVAADLDGVPGAMGYYEAGKGVKLSGAKLSAISQQQAQQVVAHEMGHLLHKQHDLMLSDLQGLKASAAGLDASSKKLYGYYLSHTDELVAEVYAQALSPSPLTSQGLSALDFNKAFSSHIADAKAALASKFPPPSAKAIPPVGGAPVPSVPFEMAGKPQTVGSLAKSLLQQGVPDDKVLEAVKAQFPDAKTSKASLASYKVELKKSGMLPNKAAGPVVESTPAAGVKPPPPEPHVAASQTAAATPVAKGPVPASTVTAAAKELFKEGMLDVNKVADVLKEKFPDNAEGIKAINISSWKSNFKKTNPADFAAGVKKAEQLAAAGQVPKVKGSEYAWVKAQLGPQLETAKAALAAGKAPFEVYKEMEESLKKWISAEQSSGAAAKLVELATESLQALKAQGKPYLDVLQKPAASVAESIAKPKLHGKPMGVKSQQVLAKVKAAVKVGQDDKALTALIEQGFGSLNEQGAKDLIELAKYQVKTGDLGIGASTLSPKQAFEAVDMTPARPVGSIREAFPPPPRFAAKQRAAAIRQLTGEFNASIAEDINVGQRKLGLPELTAEEGAAIRAYTGSSYRTLNTALRADKFTSDNMLQAYVEAAQSGMSKMPKFNGLSSRGLTLNGPALDRLLAVYRPGAIVEDAAFVSTSSGDMAAFGGNVFMKVQGKTGVDVAKFSHYRGEREVLFAPGTQFKISKIEQVNGKHVIWMEEV
jgi:SPP1 gp7 family putative phage head morphogenesis protein